MENPLTLKIMIIIQTTKLFLNLEEVVELDVEKGNELTIELFNNFEENLDFNLTLYSYNGSIEEFNNSQAGFKI